MSSHLNFYSISEEDKSFQVVICRDKPLKFSVHKKYIDEVRGVIKEHPNLMKEDESISLFEHKSIIDCMDERWLYNKKEWLEHDKIMEMNGADITALFVDYIREDIVPSWLNICRWYTPLEMGSIYKDITCRSDAQILDDLMFLSFENIEGETARLSTQRVDSMSHGYKIPTTYHFNKGVDFKAIIASVRERYNIKRAEDGDIAFAISKSIKIYLEDLTKSKDVYNEVVVLIKASINAQKCKSAVASLLEKRGISLISNGGMSGGIGEGYYLSCTFGFNKGEFIISRADIVLSFKGEVFSNKEMTKELMKAGTEDLWELIYQEHNKGLFDSF